MASIELIGFTKENPVSIKTGFKSKSDYNSFGFGGVMEKVLRQRQNEGPARNTDKYSNEPDCKAVTKELNDNPKTCNKKDNLCETSEDEFLLKSITKKDIEKEENNPLDSVLAALSGLLNLDQQDAVTVKDILNNTMKCIEGNEPMEASIINEIRTIFQGIEFPNKEDIENAINLLTSLKQESIIAESIMSESGLTRDDLKMCSELKDSKMEQKLNVFDSRIQKPNDELMEKTEASRPMDINNATDDKGISEEAENDHEPNSDNNMDKKNSIEYQIEKLGFVGKRHVTDKSIEIARSEYITPDVKSLILNDTEKTASMNLKYLDKTESISKEDLFNQIIENSKLIKEQDISEIRIQLKPDSLGKLTISLIMEKGEMTAKFIAENNRVKEAIESNFSELKDSLSQKGINIQNLSVSVGQHGKWQYENQNFRAWKNNVKKSSYIGNVDLELEESVSDYENPYNVNKGHVDIKV